jgi:hypothetical protein
MFAAVANWLRGMWPDSHFCSKPNSDIALIVVGVSRGQCLQSSAVRHVHQGVGMERASQDCNALCVHFINENRASLVMRTQVMLCCYLLLPLRLMLPDLVFLKREVKRALSFNGPGRSWAEIGLAIVCKRRGSPEATLKIQNWRG